MEISRTQDGQSSASEQPEEASTSQKTAVPPRAERPLTSGKTIFAMAQDSDEEVEDGLEDEPSQSSQPEHIDVDDAAPTTVPEVMDNTSDLDDDDDEQELPHVENPSTDIRGDLETLLSKDLDFKGSFHFEKQYNQAPNPLLRLDGAGQIGLPLSKREAKHVISYCRQAPFGQGERTVVDKAVRDTWEMDATQVHFDNPEWKTFVRNAAGEVCVSLGVDVKASQPWIELYKLLIYKEGSHFLPHQDTEKANGMFATMVILLPSPFTGAELHLSHSGLSAVVDYAATSHGTTSVLSWYTDVTHEVKPIQSGYRLALSYNLIHTGTTLRPSLPNNHEAISKLRHILLSWQQNLDASPEKIIYLLEHKYSHANLRGSALKGSDAHRVAVMETMAKELQMRITLATIECHEHGPADDDGPPKGLWSSRGEEDPSHLGFLESEHEMTITHLVDLDGNILLESLDFNGSEKDGDEGDDVVDAIETIPVDLQDIVENGNPDSQEYEGYQGNGAGTLDRWYRRTVMVVWPIRYEARIIQGENYEAYALETLTATKSKRASRHEQDLLDYFVNLKEQGGNMDEAVLRAVCTAACQWKDISLWQQNFDECQGHMMLAKLGASRFYDAIGRFGLESVQSRVEKTLAQEPRNSLRLNFLRLINPELVGGDLSVLGAWISKQRRDILLSLKSFEPEDVDPVVSAAGQCGDVSLLEKIISQVKVNARPLAICALAVQLHPDAQNGLFKSPEEMELGRRLVRELLAHSIDTVNFFQTVSASTTLPRHPYTTAKPTLQPDSNLAYHHLVACVQTKNHELSQVIVEKVTAAINISTHASYVLVPLLPRLAKFAEAHGTSVHAIPGFPHLYLKTLPFLLQELKCRPVHDEEIEVIFQAIDLGGGLEYLMESVLPNLNVGAMNFLSFKKLVMGIQHRKWITPIGSVVNNLVGSMVKEMKPIHAENIDTGIQLLGVAYETGNSALYGDILSRIFLEDPRPLSAYRTSTVLGPSIRPIRAFLTQHGVEPMSPPFASYLEKVISAMVKLDLGPKPTDVSRQLTTIRGIKCTCHPCTQIIKFFGTCEATLYLSNLDTQIVNHVQTQLRDHCGAHLATSNASGHRRHLTLVVNKKEAVLRHSQWQAKRQSVLELVKMVSFDETIIHQILGAQGYHKLLQSLNVGFINAALPPDLSVSAPDAVSSNSSTGSMPVPPAPQTSKALPLPRAAVAPPDARSPPRKKRKTEDIEVIDLTSP